MPPRHNHSPNSTRIAIVWVVGCPRNNRELCEACGDNRCIGSHCGWRLSLREKATVLSSFPASGKEQLPRVRAIGLVEGPAAMVRDGARIVSSTWSPHDQGVRSDPGTFGGPMVRNSGLFNWLYGARESAPFELQRAA